MKTRKFARFCSISPLPRRHGRAGEFRIVHFTKLRKMRHTAVRGTLTSMGSLSREKVRQKHDGPAKGRANEMDFAVPGRWGFYGRQAPNLKSWLIA